MLHLMRAALVAAAILFGATPALAQIRPPAEPRLVDATLVSAATAVVPGGHLDVLLRQNIAEGWHTYWRNPGAAGLATTLSWTLPAGWRAGELEWPRPERFETSGFVSFGYAGEVLLPVRLEIPTDAPIGPITLRASVSFLVCQDVCIPERAELHLPIAVASVPVSSPGGETLLARARSALPRGDGLSAVFALQEEEVVLVVRGVDVRNVPQGGAYFYPYDSGIVRHETVQTFAHAADGLVFRLPQAEPRRDPGQLLSGIVDLGDRGAYEIHARFDSDSAAAFVGQVNNASSIGFAGVELAQAALLAFLGGLILNLMPCVFPIISMKGLSLAQNGSSPARARADATLFLVGVLASFLGLAALMIALRSSGAEVGWGFQLQSPAIVAALALLMLAAGLNLSGVFEIGTSVQSLVPGALPSAGKAFGAILTGALAVVVAAPCTAPLMGPALGWALTQAPGASLTVFAALGLGFAFPYCVLCFSPGVIRLLPRPGAWMAKLKSLLAFPMYGAAAWLVWVFALQTGVDRLPLLFAAALTLSLGAWFWGEGQRAQRGRVMSAAAVAAMAASVFLASLSAGVFAADRGTSQTAALTIEPWSRARLAQLQDAGTPVFVEFTAAWCITCQVNHTTVLTRPAVSAAFARTGAAYLRADWTTPDAEITAALAEQGRSGVPLYLLYDGAGPPRVLPQLLTEQSVLEALAAFQSNERLIEN